MARGFTLIFWGLILIFIEFRIDRFEIAPDFIGYALIALGGHSLWQYTHEFRIVRNLAAPLILISLPAFGQPVPLPQVLMIPHAVLTFLLVWFLLKAVIVFCEERGRTDFADHTRLYRWVYAGIAIFAFLLDQAARFEPEAAADFINLIHFAGLVLLCFILRLLYVVRHEFDPDSPVTSH